MLDFAVNRPNASFKTFLKAVKPIVKSMYDGDEDKVTMIETLSLAFNKALRSGQMNRECVQWLDERRTHEDEYDRDLQRSGW
jgi:hypothetical protein